MKQLTALEILKSGQNVFMTGSAGTGKTYVLRQFINYLKERHIYPTVVAPTGIAASHLKGQTVHSFFSLGIRETLDIADIGHLLEKKYLQTRFRKLKLLIIDEVSMISPEVFTTMDIVLKAFKENDEPFGGVQVVVSGDFFQLPPISKTPKEKRFAWQSTVWKALDFQTCYLQEKFRQDDNQLIGVLDEIRSGKVTDFSHKVFEKRWHKALSNEFEPTKLYTHNADVDRINHEALAKLEGKERVFVHESKGSEKNIAKVFKSSLVLEALTLKKNAVVIFIKNNTEEGYVNGTTGVVIGFSSIDNLPIVRTTEGRKIKLDREDWNVENDSGSTVATVSQVPLRLAWAITIHKSQGMTLDSAEIDLAKTFEVGQGYVALSRLKNIEGLKLIGINDMALRVDPLILHIDDRIKNASKRASEAINAISQEAQKRSADAYIKDIGGLTSHSEIQEAKKQIASGQSLNGYKTPTHNKTKGLIEEAKNLMDLAKKRGLSRGTILNHLSTLQKENSEIDLDKFKPSKTALQKIQKAVTALHTQNNPNDFSEDGQIKLKPLFDQLDGKIGYDDIRLGLLFVG